MNTEIIHESSRAVLEGKMSFPEVVSKLLAEGAESYHADYVAMTKTYYGAEGAIATTPIMYEGLPAIPEKFDAPALRAALLDSQLRGQVYRDFTRRAMAAGVQGYIAFLRGNRVIYWGRGGDQHIEWFPGAAPSAGV